MNVQVAAKVKAMNAANATGWVRARLLCEQVLDTNTNQARGFLSANKAEGYQVILDSGKLDKRNPTVRKMLTEFQEYCKTHEGRIGRKPSNGETPIIPRASQGDSGRAPRAGAPTMTYKEKASLTIKDLDGATLIRLRKLAEEFGGIEKLEESLKVLKGLQLNLK